MRHQTGAAQRRVYNYTWFRLANGFPYHPKWRVVADMTGAPIGNVVSVVTCILCSANSNKPRGSIQSFRVFECASSLKYDPAQVQAIMDALCDPRIGFIDQEYILDWDQWNPGTEDPTNAERQRRFREKRKLAVQAEADELRNGRNGVTPPPASEPARNGRNGAHVTAGVTGVTRDILNLSSKNNDRNGSNGVTDRNALHNVQTNKEINRLESEALDPPVDCGNSGDYGENSAPPGSQTFESKKEKSPQRSLASAPRGGALTRAASDEGASLTKGLGKAKFTFADAELDEAKLERIAARVLGRSTGAIDESDEGAFRRFGIEPLLPNPFESLPRAKPQSAEQTREALRKQFDYLIDDPKTNGTHGG